MSSLSPSPPMSPSPTRVCARGGARVGDKKGQRGTRDKVARSIKSTDPSTCPSDHSVHLRTMSNPTEVSQPPVVLGIHLAAEQAEVIRQRARDNDRSVSSELRRQLFASGYLPRPDAEAVPSPR